MQIPLVLVLWEHQNYGGIKRTVVEDVETLGITNFNDKTSCIGVHAGPDAQALGFQPTASLYEHPAYEGVEVVLPAGLYPNLNMIGLGDAFRHDEGAGRIVLGERQKHLRVGLFQ